MPKVPEDWDDETRDKEEAEIEETKLSMLDSDLDLEAKGVRGSEALFEVARRLRPLLGENDEAPAQQPYTLRNKPIIREQLNPRRKADPSLEDWWVKVPQTKIGWAKTDIHKLFHSRKDARAFAQKTWRDHWKRRVAEDAVVDCAEQRWFSVNERKPDDLAALEAFLAGGFPKDVVISRKGADLEGVVSPTSETPDDPMQAERDKWLSDDAVFRKSHLPPKQDFPYAAFDPRRVLVVGRGPGLEDMVEKLPKWATVLHTGDHRIDEMATFHDHATEAVFVRGSRYQKDLMALSAEPTCVYAFGDQQANLVRQARLAGIPTFVNGKRAFALKDDARTELRQWLGQGRDMLREAKALISDGDKTSPLFRHVSALSKAAERAVTQAMPSAGTQALHPDAMRQALEGVCALAEARDFEGKRLLPGRVTSQASSWADAAEALAADSLDIFAFGRIADDFARELKEGVATEALASSTLTGAIIESGEMYATRMPSGQFILWNADKGDLTELPPPRSVRLKLFDSLDDARNVAARRGAALTVAHSGEALEMWEDRVTSSYPEDAATKKITDAFTPALPTPQAGDVVLQGVGLKTKEQEWFLAPWGKGKGVLWTFEQGEERPRFACVLGDNKLGMLQPQADIDPLMVQTGDPQGYSHLAQAAKARWGNVEVKDLPESLASKLVKRGIVPEAPSLPDDVIWHVTPHPQKSEAYAWAYVPRSEGMQFQQDAKLLQWQSEPEAERFKAPSSTQAVKRALEELRGAGLVAAPSKTTPFEVADAVLELGKPKPKVDAKKELDGPTLDERFKLSL